LTDRKPVKLSDVAAHAGVTIGTASKALAGSGSLRLETRQRVLAAAELLNYYPNQQARTLTSGRSYTVGLITSDTPGRFSVPVMQGAEDSLATGQMAILFCDARNDSVREQHWIRTLVARNVDGFIVTAHRSDPRSSISSEVRVPVIYAYSPSEDPEDVSVVPDDVQGGELAGQHLIDVGRTRIAYVGGPESYLASHLRLEGLNRALSAAGLSLATAPLFVQWEEDAGRQAARILSTRAADFDAVFCASDQIARGLMDEFTRQGAQIPQDFAVVGFDDWDTMTLAAQPQLTSVGMNLTRVGQVAATRLLEAIGGQRTPGLEYVPCELAVRASSV
jgi:LacI family transcriptional regulator